MFVNIKIHVKNEGTFTPKGFFYKGKDKKLQVVIVGCEIENNYIKKTFPFKDCEIILTKVNQFGDSFTI